MSLIVLRSNILSAWLFLFQTWIAALLIPTVDASELRRPQVSSTLSAKSNNHGSMVTVQSLGDPVRLIGRADQPCPIAAAVLSRLRHALSVSVTDGLVVNAETLKSFSWQLNAIAPAGPAYLVIATEGPVRFQLEGTFGENSGLGYALTPDAAAPFRIKQFLKNTRVIIPLHVDGAASHGELKIRPLLVGSLRVSAAIIGVTECGEDPDPSRLHSISPSNPDPQKSSSQTALHSRHRIIVSPHEMGVGASKSLVRVFIQ